METSLQTPSLATQAPFKVEPPLLNSATPWATTIEDLRALYECSDTGAVTIRTSLLNGFPHNAAVHQYTFFSASEGYATAKVSAEGRSEVKTGETSSLNTLGYSPIPLDEYIFMLVDFVHSPKYTVRSPPKPFIVSITGTAAEVGECYKRLSKAGSEHEDLILMMEINLSCPNILDKPPPAYDGASLAEYIRSVGQAKAACGDSMHVGIKTPPYTYQDQYTTLIHALETSATGGKCPISFITATNTLGSCLVLNSESGPALGSANGSGIGGVAGDAIHSLALGNVHTIRTMLDASPHSELQKIAIIGVGGVSNAAGFKRMRSVGASAVGVGTALGREGVSIFSKISQGLSMRDLTS